MFNLDELAVDLKELSENKTEYLIDEFLVKEAITLIYGAASQGKTWFVYGLVKKLIKDSSINKVYYIDLDNPKRQLMSRGVDKNLLVFESVKYITKGSLRVAPLELLERLKKESFGRVWEDVLFVFDSTRDFVDVKNDKAAREFMEVMKALRESGATVLLIHHATKSGKFIEGSAEFSRAADNVYELRQKLKRGSLIYHALRVENDRDPIKNKSFFVNTKDFELQEGEDSFATIASEDEEFIREVLGVLSRGMQTQGDILAALGKKRDDKGARVKLERYTGEFWGVKKDGRRKLYYEI